MSASANPDIVDDGLVFLYDTDDGKSYKGEPTTNYGPASFGDWATEGTAERLALGNSYEGQPTYNCRTEVGASYKGLYKTVSGLRTAAGLSGTVTVSCMVRNNNSTSYNMFAYIGHDFTSTRNIAANSDWQKVQWTVNQSSMNNDYVEFRPYTNNASIYLEMTMPMVEVNKGHATQFVDGTRSATQGLIDRTGNSTIDLSPASYDSNAQITFDGTDDYITLGSDSALQGIGSSATIECWFKSSATGSKFAIMVGWGDGTSYYSNFGIGNWFSAWSDESIYVGINSAAVVYAERDGSAKYHDGNWHHAVALMGYNNHKIYVDGSEVSVSFAYGSNSVSTSKLFGFSSGTEVYIGLRPYGNGHFQGELPVVKIYNRLLSDDEVLQNYNAIKSRFV